MMHPSAENYSIPAPTSTIPDEVFSQRQLISIGTDGIYSGIPKLTTVFPYPCSALPKPNVLYAVIRNNHVKLFYRSDYFYESDLKEDNNMDLIHYVKPTELSLDAIYGPKVDVRLEDSFIRGWIRAGDCRWVIELSRETHPF